MCNFQILLDLATLFQAALVYFVFVQKLLRVLDLQIIFLLLDGINLLVGWLELLSFILQSVQLVQVNHIIWVYGRQLVNLLLYSEQGLKVALKRKHAG